MTNPNFDHYKDTIKNILRLPAAEYLIKNNEYIKLWDLIINLDQDSEAINAGIKLDVDDVDIIADIFVELMISDLKEPIMDYMDKLPTLFFSNAKWLIDKDLIIPENISVAGQDLFYNCNHVKSITFEGPIRFGAPLIDSTDVEDLIFKSQVTFHPNNANFDQAEIRCLTLPSRISNVESLINDIIYNEYCKIDKIIFDGSKEDFIKLTGRSSLCTFVVDMTDEEWDAFFIANNFNFLKS